MAEFSLTCLLSDNLYVASQWGKSIVESSYEV